MIWKVIVWSLFRAVGWCNLVLVVIKALRNVIMSGVIKSTTIVRVILTRHPSGRRLMAFTITETGDMSIYRTTFYASLVYWTFWNSSKMPNAVWRRFRSVGLWKSWRWGVLRLGEFIRSCFQIIYVLKPISTRISIGERGAPERASPQK